MENKDKLANILSKIPIFSGLNMKAVNEIIKLMKIYTFENDTVVITQGSEGDSMYIIKSGSVRVARIDNESQDELQLAILADGDYFGELSLLDSMPRSANVITIEKSEILKLTKSDFDNFLKSNQQVANKFYRNCLEETTSRFRNIISKYTFTNHDLRSKSNQLEEINKDLNFAQKIQNYMINREYLDGVNLKNVTQSYIYNPCIAIGGDFLNLVRIDDENVGFILADVTGHGITAALVTGVVKSGFMLVYEEYGKQPKEFLRLLSEHLNKVINRLFATCYYGVINLDKRTMKLSNAGHHHPMLFRKSTNDFEKIECRGPGLGMIPGAKFNEIELTLMQGDKIIFFSDGVIEQMNENHDMYGKKRFSDDFLQLCRRDEFDILNKLMENVKIFSGNMPIQDDITMILFEF